VVLAERERPEAFQQIENNQPATVASPRLVKARLHNGLSHWIKAGSPANTLLTGLVSMKKRSFLARDHAPGLSPAGTFDAVLILQ
jgi:hypothetical protein